MTKGKINKGMAIGMVALAVASAGVGAIGHAGFTQPEIVETIKNVTIEKEVEVVNPVNTELADSVTSLTADNIALEDEVVSAQEAVAVTKANLDTVLTEIYDSDGEVEYLTDDLDEDEISEIVDRVNFKNDVMTLAEDLVSKEGVEYMDDEDFFDIEELEDFNDNDVVYLKIDSEDTETVDLDFDDEQAEILVEAKLKVRDGDDKATVRAIFECEYDEGDLEIVDVYLKEE